MTLQLRVIQKKQETHNAVTLVLERKDIVYKAGQYLTVLKELNGEKITRHYSLSSHPNEKETISLTIKAVKGGKLSVYLVNELKEGEYLEVEPAGGTFTYQPKKSRNIVFWAAGSGISPILGLAKEALVSTSEEKCSLIYAYKTEQDKIAKSQLDELSAEFKDRFQVIEVLSKPSAEWLGLSGRIDEDFALRLCEQIPIVFPDQSEHYLCGPDGFMDNVIKALHLFGVKRDSIYKESFVLSTGQVDEKSAKDAQVTAIIKGKSHVVHVKADQTILSAFSKNNISLPHSCQGGVCSACMVLCTEGSVLLPEDQSALSTDDIEEGYVLTCVGKPASEKITLTY